MISCFCNRVRSFQGKIFLIFGSILILGLLVIEIFNGLVFYELTYSFQEQQIANLRQSVATQLLMQDRAFQIVEEQLDHRLQQFMVIFQERYQQAGGNAANTDLAGAKAEFAHEGVDIDLFMIDRSNVIRHTTYSPDQNLDFRQFSLMVDFLQDIWDKSETVTSRTASAVNGGVKKFLYQRTPDGKYILEIGVSLTAENYFGSVNLDGWKQGLAHNVDFLKAVRVYNYNGHSYSDNKTVIGAEQRQAFYEAIQSGERKSMQVGNLVYEYAVVPRMGIASKDFSGFVSELIYDNSAWQGMLRTQIYSQICIAILVVLLFGWAGIYLSHAVANPVEQISRHVDTIADGDFSSPVRVSGLPEFERLADRIDSMRVALGKNQQDLAAAYENGLRALLTAMEMRESATAWHSLEVNYLALEIAHEMKLDKAMLRDLSWGTLLHDAGKLAVPDKILLKPGALSTEEMEVIRRHPQIGFDILKKVDFFQKASEVILYHHEQYNGTGYPFGLQGQEIPILARICAVADAFQAMVADRPYRKGLGIELAVAELKRCAGQQFDPEVVQAFLQTNYQEYANRLKTTKTATA